MLTSLHVKNLALIEEEEINFTEGLNILTGETGAGKSIILGALSLALGGKVPRDFLRDADSEGLVEAIFTISDSKLTEKLKEMDIDTYEDEIILTRKVSESKSVAKINGEMVPAKLLNEVGQLLIDIYGQHENQSLLKTAKHLELLDAYAGTELAGLKQEIAGLYQKYNRLSEEYMDASMDESERLREASFLEHEISEIEAANLKIGEDEEILEEYNLLKNNQKIMEALSDCYHATGESNAASDQISRGLHAIHSVSEYDDEISQMAQTLMDCESILNDFNRSLSDYMENAEFDGERFDYLEKRLDFINELKMKYGNSIEDILSALDDKKDKLTKLNKHDEYIAGLKAEIDQVINSLNSLCEAATAIRKAAAGKLSIRIRESLIDLNFLDVKFEVSFKRLEDFSKDGLDAVEFMISTNPGEPLRPLKDIASGGELSRVMLALKCAFAEKNEIDTLIFDEIDAGISGRTAQAVSEKLALISKNAQIICITHLPQIAAMADSHFLIEKGVTGNRTISKIQLLSDADSKQELARMLGGAEITATVLQSAEEMKLLANEKKHSL